MNAHFRFATIDAQDVELEDIHVDGLQIHWLMVAGQLVRRPSADFLCRHRRRNLRKLATKAIQDCVELRAIQLNRDFGRCRFAVGVVAIGGVAEVNYALVNFVVAAIKLCEARGAIDYQRENAGCAGVQCPQMPDLSRSRDAPHLVDHVMGGPLARLIDYDDSVHLFKLTEPGTRRLTVMPTFLRDFRYAVRVLLENRGVTFIAVLALALGIGANPRFFR